MKDYTRTLDRLAEEVGADLSAADCPACRHRRGQVAYIDFTTPNPDGSFGLPIPLPCKLCGETPEQMIVVGNGDEDDSEPPATEPPPAIAEPEPEPAPIQAAAPPAPPPPAAPPAPAPVRRPAPAQPQTGGGLQLPATW